MAFTVLVGYDGKVHSRAALDVALGLAARARGQVVIVHLMDGPSDARTRAERHIAAQLMTKGALLVAGNRGVPAEALIADRPVVEGLVRLAEQRGADLLVVGDSRDSTLAGALTGSVCHALVHRTTLPVVMVPAPDTGAAEAA